MIPLVDLHCHLLAGLDDGPGSLDEAVRMCQRAWDDGIRSSVCLAHMSDRWPEVTPQRIRHSAVELKNRLREIRLPLSLYPAAEVAVRPDLDQPQMLGRWMGMADRTNYLLLEIPYGGFVDIRGLVMRLQAGGVRSIVAHPERYRELLYDPAAVRDLIAHGALMQVTADAITDPPDRRSAGAIRQWVLDGMVHLLGSDGHSAGHRPGGPRRPPPAASPSQAPAEEMVRFPRWSSADR
jgi:protein-tyrosine phosphatase